VLGENMIDREEDEAKNIRRRWGILFQNGALFSTLTVAENVEVPIREYFPYIKQPLLDEIASYKIAMSGLPPDAGPKFPSELSGGMVKRAGLARALALDPELLVPRRADRRPRPDRRRGVRRAYRSRFKEARPNRVPDHSRPRHALRHLRPCRGAGRQTGDSGRNDSGTAGFGPPLDSGIFQRAARTLRQTRLRSTPKLSGGLRPDGNAVELYACRRSHAGDARRPLVFTVWLAGLSNRETKCYDIYFSQAVGGLNKGST
jgi:hypothetical protein